jgi:hypothetical protein
VSPGGSLLPALKLGELIRAGGYNTSLGEICASACAYALIGGVNRYIAQKDSGVDRDYDNRNVDADGTKLGIHQFYQSAALDVHAWHFWNQEGARSVAPAHLSARIYDKKRFGDRTPSRLP